jgi:AcrR family transcriptional regulator
MSDAPRVRKPGRPPRDAGGTPVREALLEATIEAVAQRGPFDVTARDVCATAGVMNAAVNYNFATWNGLLAEATAVAYREYIAELWAAVEAAPRTPQARLEAYIRAQISWVRRMPGWGAMLNYPIAAKEVSELYMKNFPETAVTLFQVNQGCQVQLVMDVRSGEVHDVDVTDMEGEKARLLGDHQAVQRSISLGWSIMGMTVWASRGETAEAQLGEMTPMVEGLIDAHIATIIETAQL